MTPHSKSWHVKHRKEGRNLDVSYSIKRTVTKNLESNVKIHNTTDGIGRKKTEKQSTQPWCHMGGGTPLQGCSGLGPGSLGDNRSKRCTTEHFLLFPTFGSSSYIMEFFFFFCTWRSGDRLWSRNLCSTVTRRITALITISMWAWVQVPTGPHGTKWDLWIHDIFPQFTKISKNQNTLHFLYFLSWMEVGLKGNLSEHKDEKILVLTSS